MYPYLTSSKELTFSAADAAEKALIWSELASVSQLIEAGAEPEDFFSLSWEFVLIEVRENFQIICSINGQVFLNAVYCPDSKNYFFYTFLNVSVKI